jgi:hypothetical protein
LPGLHQALEAILPPLDQLERELAGEEDQEQDDDKTASKNG